ncbi:T9SS type A sorting domain-containing protein [Aquimarina sp. ERC-38]|uniref:T9SS type A sorting domain-containing protein n=1 Tax=Aquimarina sp. ERC-38 TaxID=2949996 RepID=UPI0022459CBA|nr:T9SS type A sorting domain-containing protein [Aquimarina sp. ERC-38]UZO82100.1 T9SS type A sorting domain-containing protein [Aquimarina sp. ERC-38]
MKPKILFILLLLPLLHAKAQSILIGFTHDAAGNVASWKKVTGFLKKPTDSLIVQDINQDALLTDGSLEDQITLYPNPVAHTLHINWTSQISNLVTKVQLVSVLGTVDTPITITQVGSISIDLSTKPTGLYFIKFYLQDQAQTIIKKKIIKM